MQREAQFKVDFFPSQTLQPFYISKRQLPKILTNVTSYIRDLYNVSFKYMWNFSNNFMHQIYTSVLLHYVECRPDNRKEFTCSKKEDV